jgi:hypothetical protein
MTAQYTFVPGTNETDLKKIILAIQQLAAGRSNATGSVTLATGSATTTIDVNANPVAPTVITAKSVPILVPTTASAAAEQASGNMYVSAVAKGSFTITHTNSATTGRTFLYAILG